MASVATEDAAVVLADFVSSLDNLPSEVQHLLQEIAYKEERSQDLRQRSSTRDQSIQKHARPAAQGGQGLLAVNPKEEGAILKIRADFDRIETAAQEKCALSERGATLISRHLNRIVAQLESILPDGPPPLPTIPSFAPPPPAAVPAQQHPNFANQQAAAAYQNALLQQAYAQQQAQQQSQNTPIQLPLLASSQGMQNPMHRGSRLANVAYPNPQMQAQAAQVAQMQQARQQQQLAAQQQQAHHGGQQHMHASAGAGHHVSHRKRKAEEEAEEEAPDESGDVEDQTPYCFCQRASFGEMIGCDAPNCQIEWFHLSCVGLKTTPEGSWYCSDCEERMKNSSNRRRK